MLEDAFNYYRRTGDTIKIVETLVRIQDKSGNLIPLKMKPAQAKYWGDRSGADIILKGSQMGFTTLIQAEFFIDAMINPGTEVLIVAQRDDSAKRLFEITSRMYHAIPDSLRMPATSDTTHMLKLDFGEGRTSTIEVGTAGSKSFGRGRPVHRALFTEVAFYEGNEQNTMAGIIARVVKDGRYVEESTANGQSGKFYEDYLNAQSGESTLKPHFFPWWMDPEYSIRVDVPLGPLSAEEMYLRDNHNLNLSQIAWRRMMRGRFESDEFFQQEFPESPEQAFMSVGDTVFTNSQIDNVRLMTKDPIRVGLNDTLYYWKGKEPGLSYIISVDQASGERPDKDRNNPTDYQVATVWDAVTLEQCATLRGRIEQRTFADYLKRLYVYYNEPVLVVERNHAQYGFIDMLRERGILRIYVHRDGKAGFPTNTATKPLLISNFKEILDVEGGCYIRSKNLLSEIQTYRWQKRSVRSSAGAAPGAHDDELMTAMFACMPEVRTQARNVYNSLTTTQPRRIVNF